MDKLKKMLGFLVFPLLLLMMFFPTGEAHAATDVTSKVQIDHLEITIASTGSKTEGIHGANDTSMKLKYSGKFSFPNVAVNEIKDGDYFIVKAPDNLSLTDGSLDLIDSTSNTKMGTVQVDNANHRLVFTFNDKVKDKQNIRGDFVAEATETLQKEGKTVTYVLPDGKTQEITYKVNTYNKVDVIGETISKFGYNDNNKARVHFQMKINRAKQDMTGHVVKIADDISKGAFATYIEETFYLNEAEFETTNTNSSAVKKLGKRYDITTDPEVYKADSDNKALLTFVNGKRGFELFMPTNMGTKSFFLTYDSTSPADTSTISNSAQYLIDNQPQLIWKKYGNVDGTKTEATFNVKTVKSTGASVSADITGKIKITKFDEADADIKLEGVVFEIREKTTNNLVDTVTTDKDGIALSKVLNDGKYIVKEKTPKSGYQVNSQEFEVEMKDEKGVPLNISNKRVTVDFEATKTWKNGKATDYKEVKLGLYVHKEGQTVADAKPVSGNYTPEVTESNGVYTYKWKNQLPERDVDGSKLVYSVLELEDQTGLPLKEGEKVKAGENNYLVSYNADKTQVTNTYEPPKTNVVAKKVWNDSDNQDGKRPDSITVKLLADGVETGQTRELNAANNWQAIFTDLDADKGGTPIAYTIEEVSVAEYESKVTGDSTTGFTITNSYTPGKTQVPVKKVWNDSENQDGKRPGSVTVKLLADGQDTGKTLELNKDNNWSGSFTDLEVNKAGKAIKYTIEEVSVAEYESKVTGDSTTGFTITNSYTPGKTQVPVKKVWNDSENQDGKRPGSVTVKLLADGQDTGKTLELNKDNNWSGSFTDLEVNKAGKAIKYTIEEVSVAEYESKVTGDSTTGFTITNSYTPGKTQVPVKKVWNDSENQDGKRPGSVTVKLLADGQDTGKTLELNKDNNWSGSFTDLEVNKAGKAIKYTIEEVSVAEYESKVTGDSTTGFTITNSYTPGKTQVPVKKVWNDSENQDGKRPGSVTVKLLADGQDTGKTLELNKDNNWSGNFTDLDVNKAGKAIVYSVVEVTVPGYNSEVTGDPVSGFTITNNYTPETVDVTVTKNWNDADNQDGKRPDKITVNLLADGTKIDSKEVQAAADGTWSVEFTKLAKFKDGKEIKYTVTEEAVAGYESSIDNFTITNSHDPEKINISGTKVWNDNNDQDGKRPTKITVQVLKGEQVVAEVEVSAETDWKFEFKDLPKYEKGKEITYELKEVSVEHYTTEVTGKDGKYTITNTHTPAKINVKGQKIWNDANNKDGIRPDSIVVKLLANGVETGKTATASVASGWTYEFTDLDRYQDGGKEIVYTVKEAYVPKGYTSEVIGTNIVNYHKPKDPEPNKPQDPEPNKPKDPEPNKPQDPEPNKPKDPEPGKPGQKPQLPKTGEEASSATVVTGLALMVITGGLYFVSRKNK